MSRYEAPPIELPSEGLSKWRAAVERATSASQLAVCASQLEKCVTWEKSSSVVVMEGGGGEGVAGKRGRCEGEGGGEEGRKGFEGKGGGGGKRGMGVGGGGGRERGGRAGWREGVGRWRVVFCQLGESRADTYTCLRRGKSPVQNNLGEGTKVSEGEYEGGW